MTPEEKAKELIEKFSPLVTTWDCYWDTMREENEVETDAKACAIICVDEIIEVVNYDELRYWEQVKSHLEG